MSDEKSLKEQFNILFDDLDDEQDTSEETIQEKDQTVKNFFMSTLEPGRTHGEPEPEFSFEDFEEEQPKKKGFFGFFRRKK